MSLRRKKKAIGKVIKLLNLATSTNSSESSMALRHAESIILQNGLVQGDIPMYQLCDRNMLFKVSWNGVPRHAKISRPVATESHAQRRFSEKPADPNRTYANARTILDDFEEELDCNDSSESFMETKGSSLQDDQQQECWSDAPVDDLQDPFDQANIDDLEDEYFDSDECFVSQEDESLNQTDAMNCSAFESDTVDSEKQEVIDDVTSETEQMDSQTVHNETHNADEAAGQSNDERVYSHDNVINAASAFRPSGEQFKETLRNQYSSSNPDVPFEEDSYWAKVHGLLVDFDESDMLVEIDGLEGQLSLAQESLKEKRSERVTVEQEEQRERSERARIEQSFEEAMERAFQARARAYEVWETKRSQMRMDSMRAEQDAQQGFQELSDRLSHRKDQYMQHLQLKEDYRAAKIMHELRRHLALAASGDEQAKASYETVISIMSESGLSLRDLEFSDIRNKSLFIRLLERESAQVSDVHQRELYTEEMLDKFLVMSRQEKPSKPSENPVERVERLLKGIEGVGHFESQKVMVQVLKLMEDHQISVRDLDYACINKYSVFICLINWEAEQIHSLSEREQFTSSILEEYVQHSVQHPKSSQKA